MRCSLNTDKTNNNSVVSKQSLAISFFNQENGVQIRAEYLFVCDNELTNFRSIGKVFVGS